jgi:hypothetical protein
MTKQTKQRTSPDAAPRTHRETTTRDPSMLPQFLGTNAVGWILTAIVLLLIFINGAILKKPLVLLLTGTRTTGVVVAWKDDGTVKAPIVEFVVGAGTRVRVAGRVSTPTPSVREGDAVTVFYRASDPEYAQLMLLKEFLASAAFLGILAFVVVFWMAAIMMSDGRGFGDPGFGDPLRLLPRLIPHLRLNPVRFPQLFVLALAIPGCGIAANSLYRDAVEMRTHGIRVVGHVTEFGLGRSRFAGGGGVRGWFPMIDYEDASGSTHSIRRAAAWPVTRLHTGDAVGVIYLARRPEKGIVDSWDELYLVPVVLGLFMLAFSGIFVATLKGILDR